LYSAYPLVLELQILLILEYRTITSIPELIKKLKDIASYYNALFSWDNIANSGYLKMPR
jgi:hypothetical protein